MDIEAVIFDLDGVLINTELLQFHAWQETMADQGYLLKDADFSGMVGADGETSARYVVEKTGADLDWQRLMEEQYLRVLNALETQLRPEPGAVELVKNLAREGFPLGIATNSPAAYVDYALQVVGLRPFFRALACRDHVANGKPAPDLYLTSARFLGVDPRRCLAIEDSPPGFQAASSAGMRCIAVPGPTHSAEDFPGAWGCFRSLDELNNALVLILK